MAMKHKTGRQFLEATGTAAISWALGSEVDPESAIPEAKDYALITLGDGVGAPCHLVFDQEDLTDEQFAEMMRRVATTIITQMRLLRNSLSGEE